MSLRAPTLLVCGLLSVPAAHAQTILVPSEEPTVGDAITAIVGATGDAGEIVIDSDAYDGTDEVEPLPAIDRPLTIRSDEGTTAVALPPIYTAYDLELDGLTVRAGTGQTPTGTGAVGGVWVSGADLVATDLVVTEGGSYTAGYGIHVAAGSADLAGISIESYPDTSILLEPGDAEVTLDLTGCSLLDNPQEALWVTGPASGSITDCTFDGNATGEGAMATVLLSGGTWAVGDPAAQGDDVVFVGNGQASLFLDTASGAVTATVDRARFEGNTSSEVGGGIAAGSAKALDPVDLAIANSTFLDNRGRLGADLLLAGGSVTVEDTTFTDGVATPDQNSDGGHGGSAWISGSATFTDADFAYTGPEGVERAASLGGAIYLAPALRGGLSTLLCDRCTFEGHVATEGTVYVGAAAQAAFYDTVATGLSAGYGGFASVGDLGLLTVSGGTFTDLDGGSLGGFADLAPGAGATVVGATFDTLEGGKGGGFVAGAGANDVYVADSTFVDAMASAGFGGLVYLESEAGPSDLLLDGVTATGSFAAGLGGGVYVAPAGSEPSLVTVFESTFDDARGPFGGGALWVGDGHVTTVEGSTFANTRANEAGSYGGAILAGAPHQLQVIDSVFENARATVAGGCIALAPLTETHQPSTLGVEGSTFDGCRADEFGGGAIAGLAPGTTVSIHGSTFTGNDSRRGAALALAAAHEISLTCNEFCANAGTYGQSAFVTTEGAGDVVEPGSLIVRNNTFNENLPVTEPRVPLATALHLDLKGFGATTLEQNTFFGAGSGAGARFDNVPSELVLGGNLFEGFAIGVDAKFEGAIEPGHNLWFDNDTDSTASALPHPTTGLTGAEPDWMFAFGLETCGVPALLAEGSPGVDQGPEGSEDWWDDSRADIGAYGGPGACLPDGDGDGHHLLVDCDDEDPTVHPDAPEIPYDGIDNDCADGDECDVDGDGVIAVGCTDDQGNPGTDCRDDDASIPTTEVPYDGIDQDCDGSDLCDVDGDGWLHPDCGGLDCDDDDGDVHPQAPDACYDGIDADCAGDDDFDCDGDGHASAAEADGYDGDLPADDCADDDPTTSPSATEIPYDGIDQDCDGADLCDRDGDGFESPACGGDDCNDADATVYPGAEEIEFDGIDQDCDGWDACDADGDGQMALECGGVDCDDSDASIYLGAEEIPYDGIDQDCDWEDSCDLDGDGYEAVECGGLDCDDQDAWVFPGAREIPDDGVDQDCNGTDLVMWAQGGSCSTVPGGASGAAVLLSLLLPLLRRRRLAAAGLAVAAPGLAGAQVTIEVPGDHSDLLGAIGAAEAGDTILIDSDAYPGETGPLPYVDYDLTILSDEGAQAMTNPMPPLYATGALTLEGLRIRGGVAMNSVGNQGFQGGVDIANGALIGTDLVFVPGDTYSQGSAIHAQDSTVDLSFVTIDFPEPAGGEDPPGYTAAAIRVDGAGAETFTLTDCVVSGVDGAAANSVRYAALTAASVITSIERCTFTGNVGSSGALYFLDAPLQATDLTVTSTGGTAIALEGTIPWAAEFLRPVITDNDATGGEATQAPGGLHVRPSGKGSPAIDVTVANGTFARNAGGVGADIFYEVSGHLEVDDTTFTDGDAIATGGAVALWGPGAELSSVGQPGCSGTFTDAAFTQTTDSRPQFGGAMDLYQCDLECTRCAFSGHQADEGGAAYLWQGQPSVRASFVDSTFDDHTAGDGGVFYLEPGSELQLQGITAQALAAVGGEKATGRGAFAHAEHQTRIEAQALTIHDASAWAGGAFYLSGQAAGDLVLPGAWASVDDSTFDTLDATHPEGPSGVGGVAAMGRGATFLLHDSAVSSTSASGSGGVVDVGGPVWFDELTRECSAYEVFADERSSLVLDGVQQSAGSAVWGSVVSSIDEHARIRVHASEFTGNTASKDGTFLVLGPAQLEFTCNELCTSTARDGSGLAVIDYGVATQDARYLVENNVFQGSTGATTLDWLMCGTRSGDVIDRATLDDGGIEAEEPSPGTRTTPNAIDLHNNTLLGAAVGDGAATAIRGTFQSGPVYLTNNIVDGADVGFDATGTERGLALFADYNLWTAVETVATGDAAPLVPAEHDLTSEPGYVDEQACGAALWLEESSPGFDDGDPIRLDVDGSRSDRGAYGGLGACFDDHDGDGVTEQHDCDDDDATIHPGALEEPYDGIDQDCDGVDECDVDGDGYDAEACGGDDCDDSLASVHPGADDEPYDGIDQDCDGIDECDVDGDGSIAVECGGPDCNDYVDTIYGGAPEVPYDGIDQDCDGSDLCDVDGDLVPARQCGGDDCDDTDPTIYPGAPENPWDGIDQDCDLVDECDVDGDGYLAVECGGPDCDDYDPDIHPGAEGIPYDGIDQDCDGIDECDLDEDGQHAVECGGTDCDDSDPTIHLEAEEIPYDGIDQDCDGVDLCDVDGDGIDSPQCGGDDCDDDDSCTYPGAPEVPFDDIDQDCDGFDGGTPAGCSTTGGAGGLAWLLALGAVFLRRRRAAAAAVAVVAATASAPAQAQENEPFLDLALSCEDSNDNSVMNDTTIEWGNNYRLVCSVQYGNDSGAALDDVDLIVEFDTVTVSDIAPDLPDGVEGLSDTQVWKLARFVSSVADNPSPSLDYANQRVTLPLGTVQNLVTSEAKFELYPHEAFPVGTSGVTVRATVGGAADDASGNQAYQVYWNTSTERTRMRVIDQVDPSRRFVGSGWMRSSFSNVTDAHTDVEYRIYLPYYDPADGQFKADGAFADDANHVPVVDMGQLEAQLVMRDTAFATVFDYGVAEAESSWQGADNTGVLIEKDEANNALIGRPGVLWAAEGLSSTNQGDGYGTWRLRFDGAFGTGFELPEGTGLPVQFCFESATSGAVQAGDGTWCESDTATVDVESNPLVVENFDCPAAAGSSNNACDGEDEPYPLGDEGYSRVTFRNQTSVTGLGDMYVQLPGNSTDGKVADITGISVGTGVYSPSHGYTYWEQAASLVEVYVTVDSSDYTGPDVTARSIGGELKTWYQCPVTTGFRDVLACDEAALDTLLSGEGFTRADVTEVWVVIHDMKPTWIAENDHRVNFDWQVEVDWVLGSDVSLASIQGDDGSDLPNTSDATYSSTDESSAAFAQKAVFELTASEGHHESISTETGEMTAESFPGECGAGLDYGTDYRVDGSCGRSSTSSITTGVMEAHRLIMGISNEGTLDNVSGPFEFCAPVPYGVRFEPSADANDPLVPELVYGADWETTTTGAVLVDPGANLSYTWTPNDDPNADPYHPDIAGELCASFDDASFTIEPGHALQAQWRARVVPGIRDGVRFSWDWDGSWSSTANRGTATASGTAPDGSAIVHEIPLDPEAINVEGRRGLEVFNSVDPSVTIGNRTTVCYDYEIDSHAFDDSGDPVLDPDGATLPTNDAVSYQWIPNANHTQPTSAENSNTAYTDYQDASSEDAVRLWVSTVNDPERVPASELATSPDWYLCTEDPDPTDGTPVPTCDESALGGAICEAGACNGPAPALTNVRWIAFEFGTVQITDAEPRGTAPFEDASKENNPYLAQVCVEETGESTDGSVLATVLETESDLITVIAQPLSIDVDTDCPEEGYATPELCDDIDQDCDGDPTNGFELDVECTVGDGVCENTGVTECSADGTGVECSVEPLDVATAETCDGLDNDCDGSTDEDFEAPAITPGLGDACTAGQGVCEGDGQYVCNAAEDGVECNAVADTSQAGDEVCDSTVDADCDGDPLNGFEDLGAECSLGTGACETDGFWVCTEDDTGLECDAIEGTPGDETCNNEDSDCDGVVDGVDIGGGVTVSACLDTDDDGLIDLTEYEDTGTDWQDPDSDGDGVQDGTEVGLTAPENPDVTDEEIFQPDEDPDTTTDPLDCDTDDDGLLDGTEDADADGSVDEGETDPLNPDTDFDGLYDGTESQLEAPEDEDCTDLDEEVFVADTDSSQGTDPLDPDTDGDGLDDGLEDADGDGAVDADETDPNDDDTDDDGLLDGTEDFDADGEVDPDETDPLDDDTDDDGIQDGTESGIDTPEGDDTDEGNFVPDADPETTTDPLEPDTDWATTPDGAEDGNFNGAYEPELGECDPNDPADDLLCNDCDGDGLSDQAELDLGTLPCDDDTDDDGITDVNEVNDGTDPLNPDTDGDGLYDGTEIGLTEPQGTGTDEGAGVFVPDDDPSTTTDPLDDDSDDDCIMDGTEDADRDGRIDEGETDPNDADTDGDALTDGTELGYLLPEGDDTEGGVCQSDCIHHETDPLSADSDGDGIDDGDEDANRDGMVDPGETDPSQADTDGGGVDDGDEIARGTDPRMPGDDLAPLEDAWEPAGSGCVTGGSSPGGAWPLLALLALGLRRRRPRA